MHEYYMFKNILDSIVHTSQVSFQFCGHYKDDALVLRGQHYLQHLSDSFNALPLDQVIHGLSPQLDQGDLKTPHHPREEKIICNVFILLFFYYITRHKLNWTFWLLSSMEISLT